ncbi:MAG TPA: acyltransferase [Candidatus Limnocylindrales bacterium]|nr:acyltransferase [Candidatus Limnocylindrales bacterium]
MRFRTLDAWRGICALLVALLHFCIQEWPVPPRICQASFVRSAWLFVDFFFVLSGFVIAHAYAERMRSPRHWLAFVLRRFGRLWPLHAFALAAVVAVRLLSPLLVRGQAEPLPWAGRQSVTSLLLDLAMVRPLGLAAVDPAYHLDWNYPSWSIGLEFWVCVVFGLLCLTVRPRPALHAVEAVAIVAAAAAVYLLAGHLDATDDYGIFRCFYGFLLGHLLYVLFVRTRAQALPFASALEVAAVAAVAAFVAVAEHQAWTIAAPLLFAAAIYVFAHEQGFVSRALHASAAQRVGALSYSIYMMHVAVFELILRLLFPILRWSGRRAGFSHLIDGGPQGAAAVAAAEAAQLALALALLLAVASVTYLLVEQPARRRINARAARMEATDR